MKLPIFDGLDYFIAQHQVCDIALWNDDSLFACRPFHFAYFVKTFDFFIDAANGLTAANIHQAAKKAGAKPDPLDPYTGEPEPLAEDASKVTELVPSDSGDRAGEEYLLEEDTPLDKTAGDEDADAIGENISRYTRDEDVRQDFEEGQKLASGGRQKLEEKLDEYRAQAPSLSGDDIDAAWEESMVAGEESVGGMAPAPDQDVVDDIGEALGITYEDGEPLGGDEKLRKCDAHRPEPEDRGSEESD